MATKPTPLFKLLLSRLSLSRFFQSRSKLDSLLKRSIGTVLFLLGLVVVAAWLFDIPALTTLAAGLPSMKVNTAIGFQLTGLLLLLPDDAPRFRKATFGLAGLLLLGSSLTLLEYAGLEYVGFEHSWFDQWLVEDQQSLTLPGRPSLATTAGFWMLSLVFLDFAGVLRLPDWARQTLLSLGAGIPLTGLLTYLYKPADLFITGPFSSMAIHTAMGLLLAFYGASIGGAGPNLHRLLARGSRSGFTQTPLLIPLLLFPLISGWVFIRVVDDLHNLGFMTALFTTVLVMVVVNALAWSARAQDRWRQDFDELSLRHQRAQSKMALIWDSAQAAVLLFREDGRVMEANRGATAMFGWRIDELLTMSLEDFIPERLHKRHRLFFAGFAHSNESMHRNLDDPRRFVAMTKSGEEIPFIATVTRQKVGEETFFGAVLIRADQLASKIEQLQQEVRTDSLTRTENRHSLDKRINEIESHGYRHSSGKLACLMLDIDHFKQVNDTYGHDVGDKVLAEFSRRLHCCLRDGDKLYRYGGEEFMALINCQGYSEASAVAERIQVMMRKAPFIVADLALDIRCSMGIAIVGQDSRSISQCLKFADEAMYHAKRSGRDQYVLYQRGDKVAG